MSIKIKELPEAERPYEKLELYGEKALSSAELLAIIIKSGTKKQSSLETAQKILKLNSSKEDNLSFLRDLSIEELMEVPGIGKVKAIQIKAITELANRMESPANYKKVRIKTPSDAANVLIPLYKSEKQEIIKVMVLNTKNEILKILDVAKGDCGHVSILPINILGEVVRMKAPKVLMAHNHPSGDTTPSKADVSFTQNINEACLLLGIEMIDHLVIGNTTYTSIFSEMMK